MATLPKNPMCVTRGANFTSGYALVQDLKQRGLLDDTIVIWSCESGRTPMSQNANNIDTYGRDHHMKAFTGWVAGGGFKAGAVAGATDELGYAVTEDPVMSMICMQRSFGKWVSTIRS
jgi:Protein of unknown function (DUF1501)